MIYAFFVRALFLLEGRSEFVVYRIELAACWVIFYVQDRRLHSYSLISSKGALTAGEIQVLKLTDIYKPCVV